MFGSKKKQKDINLLPAAESARNTAGLKMLSITISAGAVILVVLVSIGAFSLNLFEQANKKTLENTLADRTATWSQLSTNAQNALVLKSKLSQINSLKSTNKIYTDTLEEIKNTISSGVSLTNISLSGSLLELTISASDPKDLYQYANILSKDTFFSGLEIKSLDKDSTGYRMSIDITAKGKS